mgnify:CR=1 FL=1
MKIHEFQAKELLKRYSIPIQDGLTIESADQAEIAQTAEPDFTEVAIPISQEGFEEFTEVQDPNDPD